FELVGLLRKSEVNQDLYTRLLQKYEEARIAEAAEVGTAQLVDPALPPGGPFRPNTSVNVFLGALLGLVLGIAQAFLLEHIDNSVHSVRELEKAMGLPTFGLIPQIPEKPGSGPSLAERGRRKRVRPDRLISSMELGSIAMEAYRCLRTNIQFAAPDTKTPCYLVTSAGPGEGKSLTTSNLAIAIAQLGRRVVLVDADMRRPVLHGLFGVERGPGLSEILVGNATWQENLRSTSVEGLHVLPAGQSPPNPAELLASERTRTLIRELSDNFDLVLVDSPPALPLTDASVLSTEVNGVFLVVRAGMASLEAARRAKASLQNVGARLLGVIFNGACVQEGLGLPGHYRYSYSHYSHYYHETDDDGEESTEFGWRRWLLKCRRALSSQRGETWAASAKGQTTDPQTTNAQIADPQAAALVTTTDPQTTDDETDEETDDETTERSRIVRSSS
ncbi:MAG: hypothetical protein CMJ48_01675, partial [Planctomycetaceae bacterium]|nr:hypothetical protein [Planctomycetaceae bacterium]